MEKFCKEEEFLKIVVDADYEMFNEILSRVFQKGVETAILYIPEAVDKLGKRLAYSTKLLNEFFEKHKDYKEYKDIVLQEVQKTELHNPLKTMEEVLEIASKEIDKKIELVKNMEVLCQTPKVK